MAGLQIYTSLLVLVVNTDGAKKRSESMRGSQLCQDVRSERQNLEMLNCENVAGTVVWGSGFRV